MLTIITMDGESDDNYDDDDRFKEKKNRWLYEDI